MKFLEQARLLQHLLTDDGVYLTLQDCEELVLADYVTNTLMKEVSA